jgi:ubiquinone/menaquinone biosynthesis C-methylase UbiE
MLQRVLEPEVMDTAEEARDYDAMDHASVNRAFVTDFLVYLGTQGPAADRDKPIGHILDVGTGTAQIPIEICSRGLFCEITAIDLAEEMLRVGRENLRRTGLENRIRLVRWDAKEMPCREATFDAAISNSIVHHIPDPAAVFAEIVRVTRPGGVIFVRDLVRPADETTLRQLVELHAAGANDHQKKMFGDSLHAALSLAEVQAQVGVLGFSPESVRQTTDRHWTWQTTKTMS